MNGTRPATLRAVGLSRGYAGERAVDGVDLQVDAGQVHALVGLNGAGKTTLLRLLVGLLRPGDGRAEILGVPAWRAPVDVRSRVGHVGTGAAYGELTVRQNVVAAARLHGLPRAEADRRARACLDELALADWADRPARVLSDGNRRRVALAAALVHAPDVLVLDEPTSTLDPRGVLELRRTLLERSAAGAAVLVSSHHLDEMARVADVITVLHRGRVVGTLDPGGVDLERQFFTMVHDAEDLRAAEAQR
ncbi:ABC transporter ATP-binding protein [Oerskovia flava]|uniref:ABC transporter ATP-binding protein n=1 Tax=Oerskovia flava TaxID=2986422 RepID=UPI00223F4EFF|nr:ABC transporter ATP-binding protein [Oerskovia sp. JB1-3-2]